jgi:two-component system response regulator
MKKDYNVIIADNDKDDHGFIIEGLNLTGHHFNCTSVYNGQDLLDVLLNEDTFKNSKAIKPDFILLDINMPVLNGFQTLKILKTNTELKKIPVYILSTATDDQLVGAVMALGAECYYRKPNFIAEYKKIFQEICTVHIIG